MSRSAVRQAAAVPKRIQASLFSDVCTDLGSRTLRSFRGSSKRRGSRKCPGDRKLVRELFPTRDECKGYFCSRSGGENLASQCGNSRANASLERNSQQRGTYCISRYVCHI